jgi:hypothetical protein
MWATIQQYPALAAGMACGAAWLVWKTWDMLPSRSAVPEHMPLTVAWQLLAAEYAKNATLADIRQELMESSLPWPEADHGQS